MSSGINTSFPSPVVTPSLESESQGTQNSQAPAQTSTAALTQEEVGIVMAAMQKLMAASPSLGVNSYGSVATDGVQPNVGLGRVLTPASTQEVPDPQALNNVTNLMQSYGQTGLGGAGGVVGNSLVHAAESGNLPDLSGYAAANDADLAPSTPHSTASYTASSPSSASSASTESPAPIDGVSVISDREVKTATLDGGDFAKEIKESSSDQNKKQCGQKATNGEQDNAGKLQKLGIKDRTDALRIATLLNSTNNERGTSGAPKTNIINMIAVLKKLNDSGQGKSEASAQIQAELKKLGEMSAGSKEATVSKEFIFATNKAASFVTQYGLNPGLTSFTEPTKGKKDDPEPWPDQAPGVAPVRGEQVE